MKCLKLISIQLTFIVMFFGMSNIVMAGQVTVIEKCLAVKLPRGSRMSVVPKDPVEYKIVKGIWSPPQAGQKEEFADSVSGTWEEMKVDSNGWFRGRTLRGGYAYVSIQSEERKIVVLEAMAHNMVYVNGEPRIGNRYQSKEEFESWEPKFNFSRIPIVLKKGRNDLIFKCNRFRLKVKIHETDEGVFFNPNDPTLPDFIVGESIDTQGAMVIVNASEKRLTNLTIASSSEKAVSGKISIPDILPLSVYKAPFKLKGTALKDKGTCDIQLELHGDMDKPLASIKIPIRVQNPAETRKRTFFSKIDGSVQYYAVNPAWGLHADQPGALFLSLHGASVEALNQANSYQAKNWGHIVAPTNRRPYGFNWEDWGRTDALEVMALAKSTLNIDPNRVYLTGHSMGGHGTWHVGGTFPDKFAAIGPSAGWISFWSYRVRGEIGERSAMDKMLLRATAPSQTFELAENYKQEGIYVIHGSADDNVRVDQAHQMVKHLEGKHDHLVFHEEPGAGHWWDNDPEPGSDCVDWLPMFDFFARRAVPGMERIRQVEFKTANPGISSSSQWLHIESQINPLEFSTANIRFYTGQKLFSGTTTNVSRLALDVSLIEAGGLMSVDLDSQRVDNIERDKDVDKIWLEKRNDEWSVIAKPSKSLKGPHRYGTFKDAINNRVVFVYGTEGTDDENAWAKAKAKYDGEIFWYQGNGAIEIISDAEFDAGAYPDRNVVIYGNAETNSAWDELLPDCPVQVHANSIEIGDKKISGKDLGCLFIRPRLDSDIASVGVVGGSGIVGMRMTNNRPYLYPGYAFPDCLVYSAEMLREGSEGVRAAGFFGEDWSVETGEFVFSE